MRTRFALLALVFAALPVAAEDVTSIKGAFIGPGTYATAEGCKKLAALKAGTERNVGTVPETLGEKGFEGWEGACSFTAIKEVEPGRVWKVRMWCGEGADEGPQSDVFERLPDGKLKVTVMDNATIFERCDEK
jgi:hypothetical protein